MCVRRRIPLTLQLVHDEQACVEESVDAVDEARLLSSREAGGRRAGDAPAISEGSAHRNHMHVPASVGK